MEYTRIGQYIKAITNSRRGNYLVFFPSYTFRDEVEAYMEKEEKSRAAYMAQSTVRRIKAQLERYVVSSDLIENIINAGYQLDEETFSKLASVIPNENDVVKAFEKASGKKIPYVIGPRRDGDIATCYSDPSKALKELGWKAERGIEEMCEDSWRWQSQNPNGYPD